MGIFGVGNSRGCLESVLGFLQCPSVEEDYFAMLAIFPIDNGCQWDDDSIITTSGIIVKVEETAT